MPGKKRYYAPLCKIQSFMIMLCKCSCDDMPMASMVCSWLSQNEISRRTLFSDLLRNSPAFAAVLMAKT